MQILKNLEPGLFACCLCLTTIGLFIFVMAQTQPIIYPLAVFVTASGLLFTVLCFVPEKRKELDQ